MQNFDFLGNQLQFLYFGEASMLIQGPARTFWSLWLLYWKAYWNMEVYAPHDLYYEGRTILGNVSSPRNGLKGSSEQKLRHLTTRKVPIARRAPDICRFSMGPIRPRKLTWCKTDVCDVNIFHSLTKFINVLYILYILTIHSYTWTWNRIFRFLTKAQKAEPFEL
jgi:hypothetical protein